MKKNFVVSLAVLAFAAPAFAQNPSVSLSCKSKAPLSQNLPVGWDSLLEVVSVSADMKTFEIETRIHQDFENKTETVKTSFNIRPSEQSGMMVYLEPAYPQPAGYDSGLDFSSVIFHFGDLHAPPTAGPVAPGTHPQDASLILVAASRGTSGGPLTIRTAQIDLNCRATVSY